MATSLSDINNKNLQSFSSFQENKSSQELIKQSFTLGVFGFEQSGKSTLINRFKGYKLLIEEDSGVLTFKRFQIQTNYGNFDIKSIEFPDKQYVFDEKNLNTYKQQMMNIQIAIILFDHTSIKSLHESMKILDEIKQQREELPIIVAGNKIDSFQRTISKQHLKEQKIDELKNYFDISAISNYNLEKMFTKLLRILTQNEEIVLVSGANFKQHELNVDPKIYQQMELEEKFKKQLLEAGGGVI
ncbi:ADP-ribosylation factor family protein (macronuclear) [Tetrahymena thermophila SB210]|uniref:ADP-ribosylation factor family protein n=1 Tax=Tetrahymena thermophila (strain SB210) TaxID=312017 RepID=W7XEE6_TETTS|nr:ADP-ribosylation factor family protein [Tetrahymena thermophila SB210]EWS74988.1 ADP-ribosylation factor family protein [Tetrahymena thermophila SB210]|eukprot:XP_012652487.1 ADP-ribosylation factor family protein [Tetrahymena thermophila SB210]